jgi:hypothetical protein
MPAFIDLTGKRFGYLVVQSIALPKVGAHHQQENLQTNSVSNWNSLGCESKEEITSPSALITKGRSDREHGRYLS